MIRYTTTQNQLLVESLLEYFKDWNNVHRLMNIISGKCRVSIRAIDWFTTNYSKKHHVVYMVNGRRFRVNLEYKLLLKGYSKKRCDPFARWDRMLIPYNDETDMETTVGQMIFFRWAFENHVIEYMLEHIDEIEADMNERSGSRRKRPTEGGRTRKRREELSVSACKCVKKEDVTITVKFS